jgi:hypothetical protein
MVVQGGFSHSLRSAILFWRWHHSGVYHLVSDERAQAHIFYLTNYATKADISPQQILVKAVNMEMPDISVEDRIYHDARKRVRDVYRTLRNAEDWFTTWMEQPRNRRQILEAGESRTRRSTIFNMLEYMGAWEWYDRQIKRRKEQATIS